MEHSYIITYDLCAPGRNYDALSPTEWLLNITVSY